MINFSRLCTSRVAFKMASGATDNKGFEAGPWLKTEQRIFWNIYSI